MDKLKLYLDTTIPNYVFNDHTPEKQKYAKSLFEQIEQGKFRAFISSVVLDEINATGDSAKRVNMLKIVAELEILEVTAEDRGLAEEYLRRKIIPVENRVDAIHVAIATLHQMDAIVSYNFEHIVRLKAIREIMGVNMSKGYRMLSVIMPEEVIYEEDN